MLAKLATIVSLAISIASAAKIPAGFVTTTGTQFELDGKPFRFAGTNCYWAQYTTDYTDIATIFSKARSAGIQVMRTWGFNDANVTSITGGLPNYSPTNSAPGQIVYNLWENGKVTLNKGATGLQHFDKLIKLAEAADMKLIVALTNNWADYGGMDVYTINLGGQYHDEFYYNPAVVKAYKTYVRAIVSRYRSSPAIMAWELANEPRCGADGTRNLPRSPAGCNATVLTSWVNEMSSYIKNIDPHHLVTVGDEGFFNLPNQTDWAYGGNDGVDFGANILLKHVDFETFHLYPDWWSKTVDWATQFVVDHATVMKSANKPVIMEEYGWLSDAGRLQNLGTVSNITRVQAEGAWQQAVYTNGLSGDMYWQFGIETGLSTGVSTDDGFTIYLENTAESTPLVYDHVKQMTAGN